LRFDDRLKTVLDSPVADARDRAVRWRQLVDLLSRARPDGDPALIGRAIQAARDDRSSVPDGVRAATARSIAGRPLDPRLVALFASDLLEVAAPVLAGATLDAETRREVAASASEEVRRFFFALEGPAALPIEAEEQAADEEPIPSISDVVARIEKLRRDRSPNAPEEARPTTAERREVVLFRWESDVLGSIAWVEGAPRAALIGRALAGHGAEALLDSGCRDLVARRAPFADMPLASAEPFGGEWRVSGAPAFAPGDGRFIGYRGIARRTDLTLAQRAAVPSAFESADSLREMIHEIKTPLNAIVGFAEIIDGQYLGPAHRRYRERAADILGHARALLAAIDDLDFAARLQSNRSRSNGGAEFAAIVPRLIDEINADNAGRGVSLASRFKGPGPRCMLDGELAERLVRRFLAGIVEASADGEQLTAEIGSVRGQCSVAVARPSALKGIASADLLDPAYVGPDADHPIGIGFAMRLVRGLARIAGGELKIDSDRITLLVPSG
jgi:signal transduction histidine kinase